MKQASAEGLFNTISNADHISRVGPMRIVKKK